VLPNFDEDYTVRRTATWDKTVLQAEALLKRNMHVHPLPNFEEDYTVRRTATWDSCC